ncbi:MAG: hypothetical protein SFY81_14830 [Verrucomicrobiota bacterium]|nr:hypothetical protein [Verrucomicrobiota bacterium]
MKTSTELPYGNKGKRATSPTLPGRMTGTNPGESEALHLLHYS